MGCATCAKKKSNGYQDFKSLENPPFRASDIAVYDVESGESRKFQSEDWDTSKHNVLLFTPDMESVKSGGTLAQDVNITYVTNQPLHVVQDFFSNSGIALSSQKIFVSYLLVTRTNLLHNGRSKRAVMYVMKDGDVATQELFYDSSYDMDAINRFLVEYENHSH